MLLRATDLIKRFPGEDGPVTVLDGVSLSLEAGESLALTGESGSGKSTLLHVIGALEPADGGSVVIDGADITAMDDTGRAEIRRTRIGFVFQQYNLVPSLSVEKNIAFQARLADKFDRDLAETLADRLGLGNQLSKYPEELSGGQQQRVAIARALAPRPALLLADEPTGNLDETTSEAVIELMLELSAEAGAALMMVTHSTRLAARLSRHLHLSHGTLAS